MIDSPGGWWLTVIRSITVCRNCVRLKPVYVQMKRMAASGGYYIAMGAGPEARIFAEPTTWTGSIGVILPHYDFSKIAEKYGVHRIHSKRDPSRTRSIPLSRWRNPNGNCGPISLISLSRSHQRDRRQPRGDLIDRQLRL